jgi:hypothetical protein
LVLLSCPFFNIAVQRITNFLHILIHFLVLLNLLLVSLHEVLHLHLLQHLLVVL